MFQRVNQHNANLLTVKQMHFITHSFSVSTVRHSDSHSTVKSTV